MWLGAKCVKLSWLLRSKFIVLITPPAHLSSYFLSPFLFFFLLNHIIFHRYLLFHPHLSLCLFLSLCLSPPADPWVEQEWRAAACCGGAWRGGKGGIAARQERCQRRQAWQWRQISVSAMATQKNNAAAATLTHPSQKISLFSTCMLLQIIQRDF